MNAYDEQDQVLSRRLRELVRLAGAGELADVETEPGGPFGQGLHLSPRTPAGGTNGRMPQRREDGRTAAHARAEGGEGTGPEEPALPDGPHAPETPNAPDAPDLPDGPQLPPHEAPQAPDLPDLPGVPGAPDVHGPGETPEIPGAPDILQSPEMPPTPDIPPAPQVPDMPEVPEAPEVPESPGIYDEPEIPDPPEIEEPDLTEVDQPSRLPGLPEGPASPEAPDLPGGPDLPDPPRPAPPDAARDSNFAMHSHHTDDSHAPDERGPQGHEEPLRPAASGDLPARGRSPQGAASDDYPTVVHLPVPRGPGGAGGGRGGPGSPGGGGHSGDGGPGGPGGDGGDGGDSEMEAELRRMLHQRVGHLEPAPESLAYLRHAIPARRAQRRRALAGAAAAVVLAGVGVPSLIGTGLMPGLTGDTQSNSGGSHEQAQSAGGAGGQGDAQGPGNAAGGADGGASGGKGSKSPSPSEGGETEGAGSNDDIAASAPSCGRHQLGDGSAAEGPPDSSGKVYGSFRVVNTSGEACTVEGEGAVVAAARGIADTERINVLDHTAGDDAAGLPDPNLAASQLVLKPGQAYEVKWAWVPDECHPPGPPKPKAEDGEGPGGRPGGNNGDSGGNGDDGEDSGGPAGSGPGGSGPGGDEGGPGGGDGDHTDKKASVVLSHTPEVGDPAVAGTELEGACAGTLYRTGVLAAD